MVGVPVSPRSRMRLAPGPGPAPNPFGLSPMSAGASPKDPFGVQGEYAPSAHVSMLKVGVTQGPLARVVCRTGWPVGGSANTIVLALAAGLMVASGLVPWVRVGLGLPGRSRVVGISTSPVTLLPIAMAIWVSAAFLVACGLMFMWRREVRWLGMGAAVGALWWALSLQGYLLWREGHHLVQLMSLVSRDSLKAELRGAAGGWLMLTACAAIFGWAMLGAASAAKKRGAKGYSDRRIPIDRR